MFKLFLGKTQLQKEAGKYYGHQKAQLLFL